MTAPQKIWTASDITRLFELRSNPQTTWPEIGKAMDRTWAACKVQYFYQLRLKRQPKLDHGVKQNGNQYTSRMLAKFAAMEAREQIAQLPPRSLTAEFFGDPLPGRSALDRRGCADEGPRISLSMGGM